MPSLEGGATSTSDEDWNLAAFSHEMGLKHLIVVTDNSHTRRARGAFQKGMKDSGILVTVAGTGTDRYSTRTWWKTNEGIQAYVLAPVKYLVHLFSDRNAACIENL